MLSRVTRGTPRGRDRRERICLRFNYPIDWLQILRLSTISSISLHVIMLPFEGNGDVHTRRWLHSHGLDAMGLGMRADSVVRYFGFCAQVLSCICINYISPNKEFGIVLIRVAVRTILCLFSCVEKITPCTCKCVETMLMLSDSVFCCYWSYLSSVRVWRLLSIIWKKKK